MLVFCHTYDPFTDSTDNEEVSIQCFCVTAVPTIHCNAPDLWNKTGIMQCESLQRQTPIFLQEYMKDCLFFLFLVVKVIDCHGSVDGQKVLFD